MKPGAQLSFWNATNGEGLNRGAPVEHKFQKQTFLHLFIQLFHKDFPLELITIHVLESFIASYVHSV